MIVYQSFASYEEGGIYPRDRGGKVYIFVNIYYFVTILLKYFHIVTKTALKLSFT